MLGKTVAGAGRRGVWGEAPAKLKNAQVENREKRGNCDNGPSQPKTVMQELTAPLCPSQQHRRGPQVAFKLGLGEVSHSSMGA